MKKLISILVTFTMVLTLGASLSTVPSERPYTNLYLAKPASTANENTYVFAAHGVQVPKKTAKPQKAIEVHNSKEFYKALKSNVTIKLLLGDYNMEAVERSKHVYYGSLEGEYHSVSGAILKNLKNVRVFADTNVVMYSSQEADGIMYDNVLILNNCSNVKF